jgi:4-amino-4-deoxy-L-arabinose transferase-like glycosyltransferase
MKFRLAVVAAAIACAALLALAYTGEWLRAIFRCEGFGCSGLGILYLALAVLIVVAFVVAGALFRRQARWTSALFAGGVALLAILASAWYLNRRNEARVAEGWAEHDRVCAQYPKLCPEKSAPLQPSQQ